MSEKPPSSPSSQAEKLTRDPLEGVDRELLIFACNIRNDADRMWRIAHTGTEAERSDAHEYRVATLRFWKGLGGDPSLREARMLFTRAIIEAAAGRQMVDASTAPHAIAPGMWRGMYSYSARGVVDGVIELVPAAKRLRDPGRIALIDRAIDERFRDARKVPWKAIHRAWKGVERTEPNAQTWIRDFTRHFKAHGKG